MLATIAQPMPGLALVLGIITILGLVLSSVTWTQTSRSPFGLPATTTDVTRTVVARSAGFLVALVAGYACGYVAGWWS